MNSKEYIKQAIQQNKARKLVNSNNSQQQMPTVKEMASNAGKEIVNNIQSLLAGNPLKAEDEIAKNRKSICESCNFYNKAQERCTKCGCYMAVKAYLKASKCPIGKW
jgi:uncharacterized paraquat-inducible protein A